MAETHETIADVLAAMRDEGRTGESSCLEWVGAKMRHYADRLEAAHRREAVTDRNQFGDAAKLREALKLCLRGMCGYCRMDAEARRMTTECVNGCEALLMAKAALAAPPRNCDKVKTSWDVLKKWHEGLDTANDIVRMLDWLLAPATEQEGGNDADK